MTSARSEARLSAQQGMTMGYSEDGEEPRIFFCKCTILFFFSVQIDCVPQLVRPVLHEEVIKTLRIFQ